MEDDTEWTLPNLKLLHLSDVDTTHIIVNYALAKGVGVESDGRSHQVSLDWKDKRQAADAWTFRQLGLELRVSKENVIFVDAKDCVTKLRIVAPSVTKIHLKRCTILKKLDIDCRLLVELVVGTSHPTIKKVVDNISNKCPLLKKVNLEM